MLCDDCHKVYGDCLLNYPNTRCPRSKYELKKLNGEIPKKDLVIKIVKNNHYYEGRKVPQWGE